MPIYKHTQLGRVIIIAISAACISVLAIGFIAPRPILWVVPVLAVAGGLFYSLTVEITEREFRWYFGPGLIYKRVALREIVSVEPVRTSVIEGWGIHLSRFGWLYNVSGFDAIAIRLRSGQRFAIGTDEPQKLAGCLKELIARR